MNEFVVTVNGKKKNVKVFPNKKIEVDGKIVEASFTKISNHSVMLRFGNKVYEAAFNKVDKNFTKFLVDGWYFDTTTRTRLQETAFDLQKNKAHAEHHTEVKAPMPGLLIKIKKNIGDKVELGEPILILEAMKMENDLRSPSSGIIKDILVKEGQSVEKNTTILIVE